MTTTKGSWDTTYLSQQIGRKFKWDVGYWPKGPAGRATTAESSGYGITRASKHPKEASRSWTDYTTEKGARALRNVVIRVEGNKLILEVDLSQDFGPSSSGKTTIIGSSEGNAPVPDHPGIQIGLNVFKKI